MWNVGGQAHILTGDLLGGELGQECRIWAPSPATTDKENDVGLAEKEGQTHQEGRMRQGWWHSFHEVRDWDWACAQTPQPCSTANPRQGRRLSGFSSPAEDFYALFLLTFRQSLGFLQRLGESTDRVLNSKTFWEIPRKAVWSRKSSFFFFFFKQNRQQLPKRQQTVCTGRLVLGCLLLLRGSNFKGLWAALPSKCQAPPSDSPLSNIFPTQR